MKKFSLLLQFTILTFLFSSIGHAQDGIPDNCEYDPNLAHQFVRYEPQHRALIVVDWRTGDDILTLTGDLNDTIILGWSLDCNYLAGAVATDSGRNTVVWQVATGEQMGFVPDAQYQTHYVTWGPNNDLLVETRKGAILWHVPTYQQVTLTEHFDPVNVRNFSRVRWDARHNQLIGNLSGGGRVVYDLGTGQEVPQVAQQTDAIAGEQSNTALIGGAYYDCRHSSILRDVRARYNPNTLQIYIELFNDDRPEEILVILEENPQLSWFQHRGWSPDCQYIVADLGVVGQDASDTYVWNVSTGERLGIVPDARYIQHPLTWHPTQSILLVETRDDAVLWHLPTNQQFRLETGANTSLSGNSDIQNFTTIGWADNWLFMSPANAPNSIQVNDVTTGLVIQSIQHQSPIRDLDVSPMGNHIFYCCSDDEHYLLWNRSTNASVRLSLPFHSYRNPTFSPTDEYLLFPIFEGIAVWHLNALRGDGEPNLIIPDQGLRYNSKFIDNTMLDNGFALIDVRSGVVILKTDVVTIPANHNHVTGESGRSARYWSG